MSNGCAAPCSAPHGPVGWMGTPMAMQLALEKTGTALTVELEKVLGEEEELKAGEPLHATMVAASLSSDCAFLRAVAASRCPLRDGHFSTPNRRQAFLNVVGHRPISRAASLSLRWKRPASALWLTRIWRVRGPGCAFSPSLRGKNRHVLPMCGIFVGAAVVSELNATRVKASRVGDRGLRSESEGRKRACRRTGRVDVEDYLVLVLGMKGNVKPPLSVQGCRFLLTRDVREKISEDLTAKMSHLFAKALVRVTWRLDVWSRFPFLERFADVSSQDTCIVRGLLTLYSCERPPVFKILCHQEATRRAARVSFPPVLRGSWSRSIVRNCPKFDCEMQVDF